MHQPKPLPGMPALLLGAAGTLARGGSWPSAGLADASFEVLPDPAQAAAYRQAFGLLGPWPLPALYGYAQRAQLARMAQPDFPFRVPGAIHLSNAQRLLAEVQAAPLTLEVAARGEEPSPGRICVAFEVRFLQAGELVATCESLYMVRRGERSPQPELPPLAPQLESWAVAADAGRRHAALSGDYNPVHLWDATARWFGQPRAILHGMATAARAMAALERAGGTQVRGLEVEFRRPLRLPATVELGGGPAAFTVSSEAGWHLLGRVL